MSCTRKWYLCSTFFVCIN